MTDSLITQVRNGILSEESLDDTEIQLLSITEYNSNTNTLNALAYIGVIRKNYD
ncbi:MAG: hypothetical protein OEM28_02780 [Nitrosopumilus sp.]|nr:hypothetical protein [Nitrosopumilus sp.]MDH3487034.1 hypothetical protein [Nitrosopumilus sp.]